MPRAAAELARRANVASVVLTGLYYLEKIPRSPPSIRPSPGHVPGVMTETVTIAQQPS